MNDRKRMHKDGILSLSLPASSIAIVSFQFARVRLAANTSQRQVNTKINTIRISYGDYRQMRRMWPMPRRMPKPKLSITTMKKFGDDRIDIDYIDDSIVSNKL